VKTSKIDEEISEENHLLINTSEKNVFIN